MNESYKEIHRVLLSATNRR